MTVKTPSRSNVKEEEKEKCSLHHVSRTLYYIMKIERNTIHEEKQCFVHYPDILMIDI